MRRAANSTPSHGSALSLAHTHPHARAPRPRASRRLHSRTSSSLRGIYPFPCAARRIHAKFGLSANDVITFNDILQSPAAQPGEREEVEDEAAVLIPSASMAAQVRRGAYDV